MAWHILPSGLRCDYGWQRFGDDWRYRYDSEHRLVEVLHQPISHTQPECVVSFYYDPLGRRISKRVRYQRMDGVTADAEKHSERETRFLWEGPRLLAEFSGNNSQVYAYSDQNSFAPLARIDGAGDDSTIYYFHNRLNGQPEAMTDSEGKKCWHGQPDSRTAGER